MCSSPPWICTSKWPSTPASVRFGPVDIPILAPEHLIACKAIFDRPKDWLDIEEMLRWGTEIDAARTLHWVGDILGPEAEQYARLAGLLAAAGGGPPHSVLTTSIGTSPPRPVASQPWQISSAWATTAR